MLCERALEILNSVKERADIKCSRKEIDELKKYSCLKEYKPESPRTKIETELESLKNNFNELTTENRHLYKEMLSVERDLHGSSLPSKMIGYIRIGKNSSLKRKYKKLKKQIDRLNSQLTIIKDQILRLNAEKKTIEQLVKVNGISVIITPLGHLIYDEIKARKRYFSRPLEELINMLSDLDDKFTQLIYDVGRLMTGNSFTAIWAVYMINLNLNNLERVFESITRNNYNYDISERTMMETSLSILKDPNVTIPKSNRDAENLQRNMPNEFRENNPSEALFQILDNYNAKVRGIKRPVKLLGKIFSLWTSRNKENIQQIEFFISNLNQIMTKQQAGSLIIEENVYASFILALAENPEKFSFFDELLEDVPLVGKIFSTVASLFPWTPEETWMILLRAESNILRAQSAKFIPELIEYSLLLMMNEEILKIENNFSKEEFEKWKYLYVPVVHLMAYSLLEKDLTNYIKRRPLAYVISPRYYVHSSLHYHVIG